MTDSLDRLNAMLDDTTGSRFVTITRSGDVTTLSVTERTNENLRRGKVSKTHDVSVSSDKIPTVDSDGNPVTGDRLDKMIRRVGKWLQEDNEPSEEPASVV